MRHFKYLTFLFIHNWMIACILLLFSCKDAGDEKLFNRIASISGRNTKFIILLPVDGCSGCQKETLYFTSRHLKNPLISYIITGHNKKSIDLLFSTHNLRSPYVFRDTSLTLLKQGYVSGYPILIETDESKILSKQVLSGTNLPTILDMLSSQLLEESQCEEK